jgi:Reverse transcriptase (RNA-dependent DNA polymerase)
MSLVKDKYRTLAPQMSYLHDTVVLAQAWKKAHTYIRRHNWYADTLELDCSAVDLESKLVEWATSLADGSYRPAHAWLVPAPKNGAWIFDSSLKGGWGPKETGNPQVLRPLAHLGIREQTVATALMLCLADCIESAQGNPASSPKEALTNDVYSYGNRLYCNWSAKGRRARFSWGNANTYSRYFQDYQQFVARPAAVARSVDAQKSDDELVYVVKLDLSAFYDNIDVTRLVACLKREYVAFRKADRSLPAADADFWRTATQSLAFSWRDEDRPLAALFRGEVLPTGLPQGLVASGFLANAYLLDFDRAIGAHAKLESWIGDGISIRIHDYCRYVDDLRLVVSSAASETDESAIAKAVSLWVQAQLTSNTTTRGRSGAGLHLNAEKTELERYSSVSGESGTAAQMKSLQHQLSGPFDMATLQQLETGLNGLLALAELGLKDDLALGHEDVPILATVARPKLEVRDDTLTRFSAYRLTKSLRMRRSMTDLSEEVEGGTARDILRHDFEVAARRLVAAWAVNPSLVQVLRYALDLFPSPELLTAVTDALTSKLTTEAPTPLEERVVFYVLAELFKAGATETGRRAAADTAFALGDVEAYRADLVMLALTVLELPSIPWYAQQQAALLLATVGHSTKVLSDGNELRLHRVLHEFLRNESKSRQVSSADEVAVSLVGYQLRGDRKAYVEWFRRFAFGRQRQDVSTALQLIGQTNQELFVGITRPGRGRAAVEAKLVPGHLGQYIDAQWPQDPINLPVGTWITLAKAFTHPSAVFDQENALLQLARALSELPKKWTKRPELLTPLNIRVQCSNWHSLNDPRGKKLELDVLEGAETPDPLYRTPNWCEPELAWMYAFGRLLRSAATGELDFTTRHWLLRDEPGWYSGIRSTWHKRRMGMLHSATALGGTTTAITPWFSNLLLGLLRWPGIAAYETFEFGGSLSTPSEFGAVIRDRLAEQAKLYGKSSNVPVYRYPIDWPLKESRQLRVVLVQGLMPATKDFDGGIAGLSDPRYRERHRNHTAALLHLVYRQLYARDSVLGKDHKPQVDLVMFPEYSIHVDDQDLMRAFSDATGSMLFYGLLGAKAPDTAADINAARWLVPQRRSGRRSWVEVDQGKWHLTDAEEALCVTPWRPYQVVIELRWKDEPGYRISGAICYDATDIALAADLKDESHMFVVAAMNKDVKTFDSMIAALRYHMYQHVLIVNSGEFGGSTAQAPYELEHRRLVSHVHGSQQIAVSVFDLDVDDFGPVLNAAKPGKKVVKSVTERIGKTRPAGLRRRA